MATGGDELIERSAGIARAAWQLEDCILGKIAEKYPSGKDAIPASRLRLQVLVADYFYKFALIVLTLVLGFFERPAWCDNSGYVWTMPPAGESCKQGFADNERFMLSGVPYLPPAWSLLLECACLAVIVWKLAAELRLQALYFKGQDYVGVRKVYFGLVMVALEVLDIVLFVTLKLHFRLAFLWRTGFLCLTPAVQGLVKCIGSVIYEFLSTAVFFYGFVLFFGWITATIFHSLDSGTEGFDSFTESVKSMFIAGVCDDFLSVMLPSYTEYRSIGLLWLVFLAVAHVLLLSLVLDTLCAAYKSFAKQVATDLVTQKVRGMFNAFHTLASAVPSEDGVIEVDKSVFLEFTKELSKSPNIPPISDEAAEVFFEVVDEDNSQKIEVKEFCDICTVLQYEFWFTQKYSCLKDMRIWQTRAFQWYRERVEPENGPFDQLITYILLVNFLLVIAESTYDLNGWPEPSWMDWLEFSFSWIYLGEVLVKLSIFSFREYWSFGQNRFDFFTTFLLLATSILEAIVPSNLSTYANMLRLLRLLRVVKQLKKLPSVQLMSDIVVKLIVQSTDILTLLMVVVFFFSSLSVQAFGGLIFEGNERLEESEYVEKGMLVLNGNDMLSALGMWVVMLLTEFEPALMEGARKASDSALVGLIFPLFYFVGVSIVFELVKAFTIEVFMEIKHEYGKEDKRATELINGFKERFEAKRMELHCRRVGGLGSERMLRPALLAVMKEHGVSVDEEAESGSGSHKGH